MRRLTVFLMTTILLMSLGSAAVMAQQAHVVQRGENLFNIAQQYGRSVEEVARANGLAPPLGLHGGNQSIIPAPGGRAQAPAPAAPAAPQQPAGEPTHIVQRGESLAIIAAQYGTTYIVLAEMNGIANPDALNVGQVLRVPMRASAPAPTDTGAQAPAPQPTTGTYTVQRGDSLAIIAARFNVNYLELARLNGIADPNILHVGQVLQVPGAPPPAAPAPAEAGPAPAGPPPPSTANTGGFELGGQALSFAHPGHMRNARMTWVKRQVK
ncbi:MAG: LysM domain-containing protein, partial [Chloroflexi bacterium]|nr:LysM domain-containing protein [Chloroflexota bacterium]